jgi:hypothetical protein
MIIARFPTKEAAECHRRTKTSYKYKGSNLMSLMTLKCFRLASLSQIIHISMNGFGSFLGHPEKGCFLTSLRRFLTTDILTPIILLFHHPLTSFAEGHEAHEEILERYLSVSRSSKAGMPVCTGCQKNETIQFYFSIPGTDCYFVA